MWFHSKIQWNLAKISDLFKKEYFVKDILVSFGIALFLSVFFYVVFKNGVQPYDDIIVGNITLPGVYKNVDFYTYFLFIIVYFFCFFRRGVKRGSSNGEIIQDKNNNFSIPMMIGVIVPIIVTIMLKRKVIDSFTVCFWLFIAGNILLFKSNQRDNEIILKSVMTYIYIYLTESGVFALLVYLFPQGVEFGKKYFSFIFWSTAIFIGLIIYKTMIQKCEKKFIHFFMIVFQILIPFNLFSLINTQYYYQGSKLDMMYYKNFKIIIFGVIILFLMYNIYSIFSKKSYKIIFLTTILSYAIVMLWSTYYNLMIEMDPFHTGETAIVWNQVMELGQKWETEFISVLQGLGFLVPALNKIVFGGTYATYAQANNLILIICAILTLCALYCVVEHKWLLLFYSLIMPLFVMNRLFLIAVTFIFLANPKIIKSPIKWTYCYILTCIIHVWFQPTYGGAVAAALIPAFIFIWYDAFKRKQYCIDNKNTKIKLCIFGISVGMIAIACLPLLKNVLHFLIVNGQGTKIANGVAFSQTVFYEPNYFTGIMIIDKIIMFGVMYGLGIGSCILMIFVFCNHVIKEKDIIKQRQGFILTISATISFLLSIPASLTRIDNGLTRIGWISLVYFGCIALLLFYLYRNEIKNKKFLLGVISLCIFSCCYLSYQPMLQMKDKAGAVVYVPDEAYYAKPEETGLKNLGYAFVGDYQYVHEAMAINEVCKKLLNDNQTYYDFTNKSIYYWYVEKKVPGKFVSSMVTATDALQKEAIENLEKMDIPLVYINKPIKYIAGESLRAYRIYKYFIEKNYNFISYKGCQFLVKDDIDLAPIASELNFMEMNEYIQTNVLDMQILHENKQTLVQTLTLDNVDFFHNINVKGKELEISGEDPFVILKGDTDINLTDSVLEINFTKNQNDMMGQIFIETDNINHNEENSVKFKISGNKLYIPIFLLEQMKVNEPVKNIRLDFDWISAGTIIDFDSIKLHRLNEQEKNDFIKQYHNQIDNFSSNTQMIDAVFHEYDLGMLPYVWGYNWKNLNPRFETVYTIDEGKTVTHDESTVYELNGLSGKEVEFLKVDLLNSLRNEMRVVLTIEGKHKDGNVFVENFAFSAKGDYLLIPVASSPNCLRADEITSISFRPETAQGNSIGIKKIETLKLID